MKKMNYIAFLILTFCFHYSFSQRIEFTTPEAKLEAQKFIIKKSAFIFEGVTSQQQNCYRSKYGFLTCTTISITKIFKGSGKIKLGTIKLITAQGGSIENNNGNTEVETISDGGPEISKGQSYIIFASIADSSYYGGTNLYARNDTTDNDLALLVKDIICFDFKNQKLHPTHPDMFPIAKWGSVGSNYKTLDDLNAFLKENGLTVQEEVEQQPKLPADSTKQK
jgi:hypothetical protein